MLKYIIKVFKTEKKLIEGNNYKTGSYYRFFPIFGISSETPLKIKKYSKTNFKSKN